MNTDFSRIITLLRKEKGINQKQAADSLGVSQSLLSHYEKGKRECGLEFVCRCAQFYGVSSDYLLGLSAERTGAQIKVDDIPEGQNMGRQHGGKGSIYNELSKKLVINSLMVCFDMLGKCGNEEFIKDVSRYIMLSVYDAFRLVYSANGSNEEKMFSIQEGLYSALSDAKKMIIKEQARQMTLDQSFSPEALRTDTARLSEEYRSLAHSLFNLIQNSEAELAKLKA